eukprot:g76761.t1
MPPTKRKHDSNLPKPKGSESGSRAFASDKKQHKSRSVKHKGTAKGHQTANVLTEKPTCINVLHDCKDMMKTHQFTLVSRSNCKMIEKEPFSGGRCQLRKSGKCSYGDKCRFSHRGARGKEKIDMQKKGRGPTGGEPRAAMPSVASKAVSQYWTRLAKLIQLQTSGSGKRCPLSIAEPDRALWMQCWEAAAAGAGDWVLIFCLVKALLLLPAVERTAPAHRYVINVLCRVLQEWKPNPAHGSLEVLTTVVDVVRRSPAQHTLEQPKAVEASIQGLLEVFQHGARSALQEGGVIVNFEQLGMLMQRSADIKKYKDWQQHASPSDLPSCLAGRRRLWDDSLALPGMPCTLLAATTRFACDYYISYHGC